MENLYNDIKAAFRDVNDFPKPGILFKDLTPILEDFELCKRISGEFCDQLSKLSPDALVVLDSRGFLFGMMITTQLGIPLIPVRKAGKLPYNTIAETYDLEYGTATIEMHTDSLKKGWNVIIHDDLLATGGTAEAASKLIIRQEANVSGYAFLSELLPLQGRKKLLKYSENIISLVNF
jgi:adenine phosphoribosyltransferase